ncbi:hypothetical protein M5K25_004412 [Dendrobium thyrsiflorum]|uniref:DUF4283 domain-containing protein n=1 Tax=Dendrobium thyrsiflorum TaxID=117978 RepID=A0ABD0VU43_DENTH
MAVSSSSNPWFTAKDSHSRSFKEVLAGASDGKIDYVRSTVKGLPALLFEDSVVSKLAAPFSFTLVGKFMLKRPSIDIIRKFFVNLKLSGAFSVGLMDSRHIAIQLANDLDYSRIFSRRVYYILGCQMRLLKWTPDFDVREESPVAPVWISFPNLRLHFFNNQVLFALGSIYGRPLQTDQATTSISRPSVARVLVELDVTKKHPREIWLGSKLNGYFQKAELENLPNLCGHYKMHGHLMSECFVLHPALRKQKGNDKISEETGINDVEIKDPVGEIVGIGDRVGTSNLNLSPVTEEVNRNVEEGLLGSLDTQPKTIEFSCEVENNILDEQMLAVLKPFDHISKTISIGNNFDKFCFSNIGTENGNLQVIVAEKDIEEGELVGSPPHEPHKLISDSLDHHKEQEISGMTSSICRQNIAELANGSLFNQFQT